jgi:signal transduction histidine kinase
MYRFNIKSRLLFSFGIIIFTSIILSGVALLQIKELNTKTNLYMDSFSAGINTRDLNYNILSIYRLTRNFQDEIPDQKVIFVRDSINRCCNNVAQILETMQIEFPEKQEDICLVVKNYDLWKSYLNQILDLLKNQGNELQITKIREKYLSKYDELLFSKTIPLINYASQKQNTSFLEMRKENNQLYMIMAFRMLFVLILGLTIAFVISRNITKQIKTFSNSIVQTFRTRYPISSYPNEQKLFDAILSELENSYQEITMANEKLEHLNNALEQKVEERTRELKRSNQELEQFAYVASHDLQEPLRMISSYTQLLAKKYKGQLDEKADIYINYAVDGASRMQTLINDLLEYSRVSTHGGNFEQFDCNGMINNVILYMKQRIDECGASVVVDHLPVISGDMSQIERVFMNLISNSLKYKGTQQPTIHISVVQQKNTWLFSVRDNGIGIDQKYKEKVFVIFQRLHSLTEYSGTGIGLAVCKRIVERHGGEIWFESEVGKGATFYFTIPVHLS